MRLMFLLFSFSLLLLGCGEEKPHSVAENYWQAVFSGDELKRQLLVADQREKGVELYFDQQEPTSLSFGDTSVEQNSASIDTFIIVSDEDGEHSYTTTTLLVRENDEWKIDARATRKAYVGSLFNATIENLQRSLSDSADEFRRIGEEIADTAAVEASKAAEQLQRDAEQAGDEVEAFLNQLDKELVKELKKYSNQP